MKSEHPLYPPAAEKKDELRVPASRFIDEKISDETDTEATSSSALAPAELKNPFWK